MIWFGKIDNILLILFVENVICDQNHYCEPVYISVLNLAFEKKEFHLASQ